MIRTQPGEIDIAFHIMDRWKFSFYDSLIISAALHANCAILFTEDLQHGQKVQNLKITNPFRKI
jgi:predicted nucleic acid-binding protein